MEYRILGPIEVLDDMGERVPLGGPKQRALLAILLLRAGQLVSVDRLMDDLWGDEPPDTARNTIQVYVSQLRKIMRAAGAGADALVTQGVGYLLAPLGDGLDLNRFMRLGNEGRESLTEGDAEVAVVRLRGALSLWRGEPLADFTYEPFAQSEIARLEELRLEVLENRLEAELETGRHGEMVAELESLLRANPHRERLVGHLMLALYRAGRQEEALEVYRAAADRVADSAGIDPGPDLQRLHEAILRQEAWLEPPVPVAASRSGPGAREGASVDAPPPRLLEGELTSMVAVAVAVDPPGVLGQVLSPEQIDAVLEELVTRLRQPFLDAGASIYAADTGTFVALFGLPTARDDDAQHAARSALSAARAGGDYAYEVRQEWGVRAPAARIALSAGRAAASAETALADEHAASPQSSAVSMVADAEPGTVILDRRAAERLPSGFLVDASAEHEGRYLLRGSEPRHVPAGPFVGRAEELDRVRRALDDVRTGRGRILIVEGEAGIGKSRLLAEVGAEAEDATWLEGHGSSRETSAPFQPLAEMLESWLGLTGDTALATARSRLPTGLRTIGPGARGGMETLERLLSTSGEGPAIGHDDVVEAVTNWLADLADSGPVVVAFEDVHDFDPSTTSLLKELFKVTDHVAVLLILTMRADPGGPADELRTAALTGYTHRAELLRIPPLPEREATELADALSPTGALAPSTRSELVARSGGNPLYLGELIRVLTEGGGLEPRGRWTLSMTTMGAMLPPALEGLLIARVHRLPEEARQTAQAAAVIGREFRIPLLQEAVGRDVRDDLAALLRAEVVREVRLAPERMCGFTHAMMQEAALASLTPTKARQLYGAVATSVEVLYAESSDEWSERLGFYFYRSEEPARAVAHLERAAARSDAIGAPDQATQLRERAARATELGSQRPT